MIHKMDARSCFICEEMIPIEPFSKKTGAAYIRVSTDKQEELSPDAQKRLLLDYADQNQIHITPEHIFIENGISGKNASKRPAFLKMIAFAKTKPKPFDVILVWKYSRFARNREDSILYKSMLRKQCNIDVISITEHLNDDKLSILIEALIEAMDEYYSINLAEEVTRGMTEKAMRGGYQSKPPLGYQITCSGKTPALIPEEAEIVKMIFESYVQKNMSFYEIAKTLNELGATTKTGNSFSSRSIQYILCNPMYKGTLRWNVRDNSTKTVKDKSDWIEVQGQHSPIISEALFAAAEKKYQETVLLKKKKSRPASTYKHYLSGLIRCAECGRTLTISQNRRSGEKSYFSFQCSGYNKGQCPISNSISAGKAERALKESFLQTLNTTSLIVLKKPNATLPQNDRLLKIQLDKWKNKKERIRQAYLNGIDTLEEYQANKEQLTKEKMRLEEKILLLKRSPSQENKQNSMQILPSFEEILQILSSNDYSNAQKNIAIKSIVEKIVYCKATHTFIVYYNYNL